MSQHISGLFILWLWHAVAIAHISVVWLYSFLVFFPTVLLFHQAVMLAQEEAKKIKQETERLLGLLGREW